MLPAIETCSFTMATNCESFMIYICVLSVIEKQQYYFLVQDNISPIVEHWYDVGRKSPKIELQASIIHILVFSVWQLC